MRRPQDIRQAGLSLVELMVALAIGMLVVMSVLAVWVSTRSTYDYEEDLGRIQETGRFVVDTLVYDLRMAGYAGCSGEMGNLVSHLSGVSDGDLADIGNIIEGRERGGASWQSSDTDWLPSDSVLVDDNDIRQGTDAITLRFFSSDQFRVTNTMSAATSPLSVDGTPNFLQGQLVAVTDCSGGDLFAVSADTGESGTSIAHGKSLSKLYVGHSTKEFYFVQAYTPIRYYIGENDAAEPVLMRQVLDADGSVLSQFLLEGVENLQILYGVDTSGDETADSYVNAAGVSDWDMVRAVRFAILVASTSESGLERDQRTYQLLDETIPAAQDRRRRRVFSAGVQVRNNR